MSDFGLKVNVEKKSGVDIVRLTGRIDATSATQLEKEIEKLIEQGDKEIALDFRKVNYLSSAGMRLLLSGSKKLKKGGGNLAIFCLQEEVMDIIKMAGFEKILRIYPDQDTMFDTLGQ